MNKKNKLILSIVFLFVMAIILASCNTQKFDYQSTKTDCANFLEKNKNEITETAEKIINQQGTTEYKGYNIRYEESDNLQYVILDYNARGALGGQYWGLYYSPDNNFYDEYGTVEVDKDRKYYKEQNGNNIFATERLCENWFFYYQDYDGNTHNIDWKIE